MEGRETSLSRYHCTRKSLSVLKPLYRAERSYHAGKTTTAEDQAEQEVCTERDPSAPLNGRPMKTMVKDEVRNAEQAAETELDDDVKSEQAEGHDNNRGNRGRHQHGSDGATAIDFLAHDP